MNHQTNESIQNSILEGQRIARVHAVLHDVLRALVKVKSREELFQCVCRIAVETGGLAMAGVGWQDPQSRELVPVAQCGALAPGETLLFANGGLNGNGTDGLIQNGQTYICNDLSSDLAKGAGNSAAAKQYHAVGVVPVYLHGTVGGIFAAYADTPGYFRGEEISLLEDLGTAMSFGLDNLARTHPAAAQAPQAPQAQAPPPSPVNGHWSKNGRSSAPLNLDIRLPSFDNDQLESRVRERTAELTAAKDRAESANQRKSTFLATMSHELRTPLYAMMGITGLLLQKASGPLNKEQTEQLETVLRCSRTLSALVNDILDISQIEAGQMGVFIEVFDLASSINKVISIAQPLAQKKGLSLCVELSPVLGQMASDQRRFEQILLNLLYNAIKFTEHGEVKIIGEITEDDANGHASLENGGRQRARLRVVDSGIGIKPEDISTVFKPFAQVGTGKKGHQEGTGLGLSICRQLSDLLGGDLEVASEYGVGSVFTLSIPLSCAV